MRRVLIAALATGAAAVATPSYADDTLNTNDPCHDYHVEVGGQAAIACVGYFDKNSITGNAGDPTTTTEKGDIAALLAGPASAVQDSSPAYSPPYTLLYPTILGAVDGLGGANTFVLKDKNGNIITMDGLTVLGLHFGNAPDAPDQSLSAFYLFDLTTASSAVTLWAYDKDGKLVLNGAGSSNGQVYTTGTPGVPEPATWAMMLLGFGGIGAAMRRGRKSAGLPQIA